MTWPTRNPLLFFSNLLSRTQSKIQAYFGKFSYDHEVANKQCQYLSLFVGLWRHTHTINNHLILLCGASLSMYSKRRRFLDENESCTCLTYALKYCEKYKVTSCTATHLLVINMHTFEIVCFINISSVYGQAINYAALQPIRCKYRRFIIKARFICMTGIIRCLQVHEYLFPDHLEEQKLFFVGIPFFLVGLLFFAFFDFIPNNLV